jgi:hypothetical protein
MKEIYNNTDKIFLGKYQGTSYFKPWFNDGKWEITFSDKKDDERFLEIVVGAQKIYLPGTTQENKMYFEMEDNSLIDVKKRDKKELNLNDFFIGSRYLVKADNGGFYCSLNTSTNRIGQLIGSKYIKLAHDKLGPKVNFFRDMPIAKKAKINRFSTMPFNTFSIELSNDLYDNNGVEAKLYDVGNNTLAKKTLYQLKKKW